MKKILSSLLVVGGFAAASQLQAQVIADWTFETSQPVLTGPAAGPYSPEIGSGSATGLHASATTAYSTPAGNGSAHSFSANMWAVGDYYQIQVSTVGFSNIGITYDQASSSTGPGKFLLEYSTDGVTFTPVTGTPYTVQINGAPNVAWNSATSSPVYTTFDDLSSISALDNAATVYIRFLDDATTSANGGTVATGGTDRMDNINIGVVPEPSTLALLSMGGLASLGFLARRKK